MKNEKIQKKKNKKWENVFLGVGGCDFFNELNFESGAA